MSNSTNISYQILELEVEDPLPTVTVPRTCSGIAFVVRRGDKPAGFFMEAMPGGTILTADDLAGRLMKHVGTQLLREKIYQELRGPLDHREFPSLDIAICTHNRTEALARCLENLRDLGILASSGSIRVLVVDNAPSDDVTERLVRTFPHAVYIRESKPGLDFARNRAVKEASGELIAFLDDDVIVDRCWLEGLRDAFTANPDGGAFTGPVLPLELSTKAQIVFEQMGGFGRQFDRVRFGSVLPESPTYPCGAGMFGAGCNMAFRRKVLIELGGFDDALDTGAPLPGGGDLDMFYRVVRAGYPLIREPKMVIYHQHRREYAKLRHQMWTWGTGSMAYVTKCYLTDLSQRPKIRRWIAWWFIYQFSKIFVPFLRRNRQPWPLDLVIAEICGGMTGLFGEYRRSMNRVAAIRRKYA